MKRTRWNAAADSFLSTRNKKKVKKPLKIGKAGHRTEADSMTENVEKKVTEGRERN